jgi:uncharacterized protein with von Willebrand factor type A (vWA) domain
MQFALEGKEPEQEGPIVMAVDCSGSMKGARYYWALGVALALAEHALIQRRPFAFFTFDSTVHTVHRIDKPGQVTIAELESWLGEFKGGGTETPAAMRKATGLVLEQPKSDVVIVSDGEWPDGWQQALDLHREHAPQSSVYGVAIECGWKPEIAEAIDGYAAVDQKAMAECSTEQVAVVFGQ